MLNAIVQINSPKTIAFPKGGLTGTLPGNISVDVLQDDDVTTVSCPAVEAVTGIVTVEYTPTTLGTQHIVVNGELIAHLEVAPQGLVPSIELLKDASYGSWIYNKVTGILTLKNRSGGVLETYEVVDNTDVASRERQ